MPSKIEYTRTALQDLDAIWDYISNKLENPIVAQHTVDGILDAIELLANFPESGQKLVFEGGLESGYRFIVHKKYMAFYRINAMQVISIDRILYGSQDYIRMLFPDLQ